MDVCRNKQDIILKMRTGDVCFDCLKIIKDKKINFSLLGPIFNLLDEIQKGLKYIERDEFLGLNKLIFDFNDYKPKIKYADNDRPLGLSPRELSFYILIFLKKKLSTIDLTNENTSKILKLIYEKPKGEIRSKDLKESIIYYCEINTEEKKEFKAFNEAISITNSFLNKTFGKTIAQKYLVKKSGNNYSIGLNRNFFEIKNIPNEITQLLQN